MDFSVEDALAEAKRRGLVAANYTIGAAEQAGKFFNPRVDAQPKPYAAYMHDPHGAAADLGYGAPSSEIPVRKASALTLNAVRGRDYQRLPDLPDETDTGVAHGLEPASAPGMRSKLVDPTPVIRGVFSAAQKAADRPPAPGLPSPVSLVKPTHALQTAGGLIARNAIDDPARTLGDVADVAIDPAKRDALLGHVAPRIASALIQGKQAIDTTGARIGEAIAGKRQWFPNLVAPDIGGAIKSIQQAPAAIGKATQDIARDPSTPGTVGRIASELTGVPALVRAKQEKAAADKALASGDRGAAGKGYASMMADDAQLAATVVPEMKLASEAKGLAAVPRMARSALTGVKGAARAAVPVVKSAARQGALGAGAGAVIGGIGGIGSAPAGATTDEMLRRGRKGAITGALLGGGVGLGLGAGKGVVVPMLEKGAASSKVAGGIVGALDSAPSAMAKGKIIGATGGAAYGALTSPDGSLDTKSSDVADRLRRAAGYGAMGFTGGGLVGGGFGASRGYARSIGRRNALLTGAAIDENSARAGSSAADAGAAQVDNRLARTGTAPKLLALRTPQERAQWAKKALLEHSVKDPDDHAAGPYSSYGFRAPQDDYIVTVDPDGTRDRASVDFKTLGHGDFRPTGAASPAQAIQTMRRVATAIEADAQNYGRQTYVMDGASAAHQDLYQQMARTLKPPNGYKVQPTRRGVKMVRVDGKNGPLRSAVKPIQADGRTPFQDAVRKLPLLGTAATVTAVGAGALAAPDARAQTPGFDVSLRKGGGVPNDGSTMHPATSGGAGWAPVAAGIAGSLIGGKGGRVAGREMSALLAAKTGNAAVRGLSIAGGETIGSAVGGAVGAGAVAPKGQKGEAAGLGFVGGAMRPLIARGAGAAARPIVRNAQTALTKPRQFEQFRKPVLQRGKPEEATAFMDAYRRKSDQAVDAGEMPRPGVRYNAQRGQFEPVQPTGKHIAPPPAKTGWRAPPLQDDATFTAPPAGPNDKAAYDPRWGGHDTGVRLATNGVQSARDLKAAASRVGIVVPPRASGGQVVTAIRDEVEGNPNGSRAREFRRLYPHLVALIAAGGLAARPAPVSESLGN